LILRNRIDQKIKPIVVSMGNYAASGLHSLVTPIHFAEENTITGSIGVFEFYQILHH
jgi:protease-4